VGSADATSWKYNKPEGVRRFLQVRRYKIDPCPLSFFRSLRPNFSDNVARRDLLSEDDRGPARFDESIEVWPEVSLIVEASPFPSRRKSLARHAPAPTRSFIRPPRETECVTPAPDAGERVKLRRVFEHPRLNVDNRTPVDAPVGDASGLNQILKPVARERLDLIVERIQ
jgi:hypothetical protein